MYTFDGREIDSYEQRIQTEQLTTAANMHEGLATKAGIDARFDRVEARFAESNYKHSQTFETLCAALDSMLIVLMDLDSRFARLAENQRTIIETLERIEKDTSRDIGF